MSRIDSRKTNIELLRILAMFMIVLNHLAGHGIMHVSVSAKSYQIWQTGSTANKIISCMFRPGGEVGVAIFFIIAGYFCIHKSKVSILKVVLQTFFYSCLMILVLVAARMIGCDLSSSDLWSASTLKTMLQSIITPVSGGVYWFVTVYVFVMLLVPLVNPFLIQIDRKRFCLLLLLIWFFGYTVASTGSIFFQLQKGLFFYSVGAFIGLHKNNYNLKKALLYIAFFFTWIVGGLLSYNIALLGPTEKLKTSQMLVQEILKIAETGIVVPICALTIFMIFEYADFGSNRMINLIAATTFGIYLFHDSVVGRELLWHVIFKVDTILYHSRWFPLTAFGTGCAVFGIGAGIDLLRMKYIEPIYLNKVKCIGETLLESGGNRQKEFYGIRQSELNKKDQTTHFK